MGSPDDPPDITVHERPKLSPGRILALSVVARIEFAIASLLAIAVCVARVTVFTGDTTALWAALGILIVPAFGMATALTIAHARQVRRPLPAVWPELAFWAVAPTSAAALLAVTALVQ
jgi:hypothetical protein